MAEKKKESGNPLLRKLSGGSDWNAPRQSEYISPVVVDGRFFVRGWHELYCFDIRKERPPSATPPMPVEKGAIPSTAKDYLDDLSSRFETRRRDAVTALLATDKAQWPEIAVQLAAIVESGKWPAMPAACDALARMETNAGRLQNALLKRVDEGRWGSSLICVDALRVVSRSTLETSAVEVAVRLKSAPIQARVACAALGQMRESAAAATMPLCEVLAGDDLWLAEGAARALAEIGKPAKDAVLALARELDRNRPRVAVQCARALANIGGPEADLAAPALTKAFAAGARPLSTHAAIALATLSPEAAKEAVKPATVLVSQRQSGSPDPLRIAATVILARSGAGAPQAP